MGSRNMQQISYLPPVVEECVKSFIVDFLTSRRLTAKVFKIIDEKGKKVEGARASHSFSRSDGFHLDCSIYKGAGVAIKMRSWFYISRT